jgi:hypothetical protein
MTDTRTSAMDHPVRSVAAAGLVLGLTFAFAQAHSWYPPECCHDVDCAPVESISKVQLENGSAPLLRVTSSVGTIIIPAGFPARHSKDHRMHICLSYDEFGAPSLLCWFVPPST